MSAAARLAGRSHTAYLAFVVHRVSGVLLTLFLPLHFLTLGSALRGEAALDGLLHWTQNPLLKAAEIGLVLLLALHLGGGLRLLALEFLAWRDWQKNLAAVSTTVAVAVALLFALQVL